MKQVVVRIQIQDAVTNPHLTPGKIVCVVKIPCPLTL